ncbi:MAG: hypothetical protein WCL10_16100 [Novosphingobium sp.]|jgi:hypothetical protein|uniref:hypothetical protein n=1 Tax=Novosphingobium sp. TaxID=1874826 RepID=UPI003015D037
MPAPLPRAYSATTAPLPGAPDAGAEALRAPAKDASPARLADELAVPAPSPVHQLQAGLAQLTTPPEPLTDELYPGWMRVAFPVASSALLWAAIVWGVSRFV